MYNYSDPLTLLSVGFLCSGVGIRLFWKVYHGDTLFPGTLWTHIPDWMFWVGGAILQIPLPLAYYFLKQQNLV